MRRSGCNYWVVLRWMCAALILACALASGMAASSSAPEVDGSTPSTRPSAEPLQVSAPSPQSADGTTYEFVAWSDGGAQTHEITISEDDQVLTAESRAVDKRVHTRESLGKGGVK